MTQGFPANSQVKTSPAPTGGLNARDGLMNMPETDAVDLLNWVPDRGGLRCRKGYSEWAVGFPGSAEVKSILSYFNQSDAFPGGAFLTVPTSMPGELFAATDDAIYDITSSTNTPAVVQALSTAADAGRIHSTMFTNSAGTTFLALASESDGYFTYDGTSWVPVTLGAGPAQVSVGDPADFVHVASWKRRLWFVERNSSRAWYLAADSVYGAAAKFDFGPMFKHGGHLSYIANWTIDAGEGIDDFLVAVGSNGDVVVYKGSDPASASTFALVGTWFIGQVPVGRRGYTQFGGDLVLLSADGIYPISYVTRGGSDFLVASTKEYTSIIRPLIGQDIRSSFTIPGWQMAIHPGERLMLVTVPNYASVQKRQYAMSTTLNRWAPLTGIPVVCLGVTAGYMFGGTADGRVLLMFNGFYDNVKYGESTGDFIEGTVIPAFSYFGVPAVEKGFLGVRPVFLSQVQPAINADVLVNYQLRDILPPSSATLVATSLWGTAVWGVSLWGGAIETYDEWFAAGDSGYCGSAIIKTLCAGDTVLTSIDYILQVGGVTG